MYGINPIYRGKLFFLFLILVFLLFGFETLMRKYLKVEKRKSFSYEYVNVKYKRIDLIIRISIVIIFLTTSSYLLRRTNGDIWYLKPGALITIYLVISEIIRAFMEWKYAVSRKAYILTISQLVFYLILVWITIYIDIFNLF